MGQRLWTSILRLGAALGWLLTYGLPFRWNRGPGGWWWEPIRRRVSRLLGTHFDDRIGPRPITGGEYAGTLDEPLAVAEARLWRGGFVRNPFARLKMRDGTPERGSWVLREHPLARRQLHLMLFPGGGQTTDVYAHAEPSNVNPLLAEDHLDGPGQNVRDGVERARELLPLECRRETVEAPDGPWDTAER